jgi:LysR family transcriptional regulator for metE and metH
LPRPALDVRDLQVALALASAGSTARAASLLCLTQPAVSRALLGLEDKLGTVLFERSTRGLKATAAGERLLSGARELLVALIELERLTAAPVAPVRLRVVCECYTAYHWLPSTLARLRAVAPDLEVVLEVAHSAAPADALAAGAVDVALLTTARIAKGSLSERPLFSDEVVFVLAPSHPLAAKKTLTVRDLQSCTLLTSTNTPDAEAHWFTRAAFGRKPPKLHLQRLPLTEAIIDVARAGLGVAVLSEWIASPHLRRDELITRRLDTGPLRRPWRFAYRREAEQAALRLFDELKTAAPRLRADSLEQSSRR